MTVGVLERHQRRLIELIERKHEAETQKAEYEAEMARLQLEYVRESGRQQRKTVVS